MVKACGTMGQNEVFERAFETAKSYADPFNEIEVDVVFRNGDQQWRVPAFWRGGGKWSVRFAAPYPGAYNFRVECTDESNPDLNGIEGTLTVVPYQGKNALLRHGPLRVSASRRYLEHADSTPFCWLGDTWWMGLSTRLSWEDYQRLAADRRAKGFNLVQIVAGLVPFEEQPFDPGFCNEGGAVWEEGFARINPAFFDYMDRRVRHLVDLEMVPAIVGAWNQRMPEIGGERLKQHWRYIIARYGAYPVVWILGGEVWDPPAAVAAKLQRPPPGPWTEVARYLRQTDPYHRVVTVHEPGPQPYVLQDESLTDFDMFQSSHAPGLQAISIAVAQTTMHYARTCVTKPLVQGEIGYEGVFDGHWEDFQRFAYWVTMLNGGAGHTYGANGVWESYTNTHPFHRIKWSFMTWEEGMNLPGSYQVGIAKQLLERYPWWRFEPHPEWVEPRSTTFLEPQDAYFGFDRFYNPTEWFKPPEGRFDLAYAAGMPGEVRFIYIPSRGFNRTPPTILGLEPDVTYHACYWEPALGIKIDLGTVRRVSPGSLIRQDSFDDQSAWTDYLSASYCTAGRLVGRQGMLTICKSVNAGDVVASVEARSDADAALILRFHDPDNCLAGVYSPARKTICIYDRRGGQDGQPLGTVAVAPLGSIIRLNAEARGAWMMFSISDGKASYCTPIVQVKNVTEGQVGLGHREEGEMQAFDNLALHECGELPVDEALERRLYDAAGACRGELWQDDGQEKALLLDAYRPPDLPTTQDYVLVLERVDASR